MKKYTVFAYIFIILFIITAISFGTYKVMSNSKNKDQEIKEKVQTELKYVDGKLIKIFNHMNNIEFENYKISIGEINTSSTDESSEKSNNNKEDSNNKENSQQSEKNKSESEDKSNSKEGSSKSEGESKTENKNESDSKSKSESESKSKSESKTSSENGENSTKVYELQKIGVLTRDKDINWENIKNEIEDLYLSIPTMTLDLYKTETDKQDIEDFNAEFDNLTKIVQKENKKETLDKLVKVYEIMVKIADKNFDSDIEKASLKTKLNIYKAYSKLDENKWDDILQDTKSATEEFAKLKNKKEKEHEINKIYVMLNELQKSTEKQDSTIFLIKYKNTLEELNNI